MTSTTDFLPPPPPPPSPPAFLDEASLKRLAEHGHLSITLPEKLQHDVTRFFAAVDSFFVLPEDQKAALYPGTPANLEEGYHLVPDEKQFLSFRHAKTHANGQSNAETNGQAGGRAEVESLLAPLWHDISHLLFRILFDIGRFLGIDNSAWYPLVRRGLSLPPDQASMTPSLLRAFRYQPDKGISEPHLDVGLLTLCLGKGRGLELWERNTKSMSMSKSMTSSGSAPATNGVDKVQNRDCSDSEAEAGTEADAGSEAKEQEKVPKPKGLGWRDAAEVTILVGETLRVLSTNRVWAGLHRVVPNPLGRDSIVFALRPDLDTVLELEKFGGAGHVPAGTLWEMIQKGKYNVNAEKEVREETKARHRREKEMEREERERERERETNVI